MKSLKMKEAEEAKALEEMVLKVESNLEATTVTMILIMEYIMTGEGEGRGGAGEVYATACEYHLGDHNCL